MPKSPPLFQRGLTTPWLFLSLGLAILAAVLGLDRWDAYRALQAQERQRLINEANAVGETLSSRMQVTSNLLEALRADLPWLLAQAEGPRLLNRRLTALVASSEGLRSLLVVDGDGTSMASNRQELIGINFRDQERYRTMSGDANPDRLYVSAPFKTPLGHWALSLGRVVVDDQGRFNGYVLAILDPEYFRLLLGTTVYAPDMRATVIHADGLVVYRAPDPEGLTGQNLLKLPQSLYRRFLDSGLDRGVLEGLATATGSERLTVFQTIEPSRTPADKPLVAAISRERSAVLAPWRQETWVRLGLFALIALVAAVGLLAYQRRQRADARWRLAAETERARDAERLRLATDGAELGVWYWDMATQTLNWSERCKVHLGLPPRQEPTFAAFYAGMHPDDRPRVEALLDQAVAARSEYTAEYRVHWPDGSEHWISAPGRVYTHPDGSPRGMGGITQDITAQKRAAEEIRALNASLEQKVAGRTAELVAARDRLQAALRRVAQSEARFRTMFAEAPLGIALIDSRTGRIDAVNDRFAAIAGRSREEMMASDWMRITHPDDVQAELDQMALLNAGEISGFQMNKRYLKPNGAPVWIGMTIAPVTLKPGESPRHLCMIEDITERMRLDTALRVAKEAAEAATQAKSEFLAHMSHEIRTPMNAVLGLAQLLGREGLSDHQADMVARIQTAGQTLLGIINDILDFSKIEAGQLRLETRTFDLATVLHKLDSLLNPVAFTKGLALRITAPLTSPGPVRGDPLRLEQVLVNLLGNAIKFTATGEVSLTVTALEPLPGAAEHAGQRLRFAVRDTGIGMSPAALASLFQPFTQADAGISRRFGGTGLGLSISQRLVALMGGTIQVESAEGQGSAFGFELTFARAAALGKEVPTAPVSELPAGPRLSGQRILVVDDSPMNRDLVERLLILEGARVTLAADGQQAVQLLQTPTPAHDAVLMDVQMPVMDGRAATRVIRDRLGLRDLPIIALTAGVLAEERQAIREAGVDAVLAKPLDLEELVAVLLRLIPPATRQAAAQARDQALAQGSAVGVGAQDAMPTSTAGPGDATPPRPASAANGDVPRSAVQGSGSPGDFPLIAGIDRERAAQVVGNDLAFFLGQLARLLRDASTQVEDCRLALLAGDRETAARRMHGLKGNAGNLGALALMRAAGALERAIKEQTPDPETAIRDQASDLETADQDQVMDLEMADQDQMTNLAMANQGPATDLAMANQGSAMDLEAGLAELERQLRDLAVASAPWLAVRDARGQPGVKAAMVPAGGQPDLQAQTQAEAKAQAQAQAQARQAAVPAGAMGEGAAAAPALAPVRLAALRDALRRHDLAAQDYYEELAIALAATWGEAETQALGEAIADLKFGVALAQIERRVPAAAM